MTALSPSSPRQVAAQALGTGLATALLPSHRLPARARRAMHAALGLGAGGATWVTLSRRADPPPLPARPRAALASAFGGLTALSSVAGFALDARLEQALARRGTRHPRLWMGVGAAALSVAAALVDKRLADVEDPESRPSGADPS
jgi:hypothetical protein